MLLSGHSESERLAVVENEVANLSDSLVRIEQLLSRVEANQIDIATNTTVTYRIGKITAAIITALIGFTHWEEIISLMKGQSLNH